MEWRGHSDMLHDIERNRLYREAIVRRVAELSAGNEQARVIDIGTGSGPLACVASASGASVVAFECVSKLAKLAKRVVDDNGLEIDIKCAHSTAATSRCSGWAVGDDLVTRPRASLMTHELLDSGLLSEGLLQATRHACDVLLEPSALTVPHSIRLYAQPVRCGFFRSAATLRTAAHLLPLPPAALQCEGAAGYLELDVQPLLRSQRAIPLAEPVCVLDLDLSSRPPPGEQQLEPRPLRLHPLDTASSVGMSSLCGAASAKDTPAGPDSASVSAGPDALITWWECTLHPEVAPLSTCPWKPRIEGLEREHWLHAAFLVSPPGAATNDGDADACKRAGGDDAPSHSGVATPSEGDFDGCIMGGYDDDELWLDWRAGHVRRAERAGYVPIETPSPAESARRRVCRCGVHVLWGSERLQQLNLLYSPSLANAVGTVVAAVRASSGLAPRCVDLADGPLLSVLAARAGGRCVCVERSTAMRVLTSRCVAQSGLSNRVGLALLQESQSDAASEEEEEGEEEDEGEEEEERGEGEEGVEEGANEERSGVEGEQACEKEGKGVEVEKIAEGASLPRAGSALLPAELRGPPFDLLLLDPCFSPLRRIWAGAQLCEIVRLRRWAESMGIVTRTTPMLPAGARLHGVLLECPDLWRRHQPVGDVSGINVRAFNKLLAPRQLLEARSLQLWQWAHEPLSAPFTWGCVALPAPSAMQAVRGEQHVEVAARSGVCHAVCAWIDFEFAAGAALRTGPPATSGERIQAEPTQGPWDEPTPWAQAVCFLQQPIAVSVGERVSFALELDLLTAAFKVEVQPQ